ncbi:MAG: hypothetical protein AAFY56_00040 [Pseudomonadota bacterium]
MTIEAAFHLFVILHIVTGAIGLVAFWVPVLTAKGLAAHRLGGKVFVFSMLATGTWAIGISTATIIAPVETHPHLLSHPDFGSAAMIRGIFGWMMLYLAILTVNLAWYGWLCIRNKRDHIKNREWKNVALQFVLLIASANCALQGLRIGMPLMIGISMVGFATVATNGWFIWNARPAPKMWLMEHVKGLVGAGISVYTAFFAFGAVRLLPEAALTPALWSLPLITGLAIILYHRRQISRSTRKRQTPIAATS